MQQRHVGVGSDRSTAALPPPLRLSDGGAWRESHMDTLPISRACEWLHSHAVMCRNECERDDMTGESKKRKPEFGSLRDIHLRLEAVHSISFNNNNTAFDKSS